MNKSTDNISTAFCSSNAPNDNEDMMLFAQDIRAGKVSYLVKCDFDFDKKANVKLENKS